jgi:hypothetical protein
MSVATLATCSYRISGTAAALAVTTFCVAAWLWGGTPSMAGGSALVPLGGKQAIGLDEIAANEGVKFGDWIIWRYDGESKAIFLINTKSTYCIYLPWDSLGWVNYRDTTPDWFVMFTTGEVEKMDRPELPIDKFIKNKTPTVELAKGKHKFKNWTVEVTDKEMRFSSSDYGARMTIPSKSAVFVYNDRNAVTRSDIRRAGG